LNGGGLNALSRWDKSAVWSAPQPSERCNAPSTIRVCSFQFRSERPRIGGNLISLDHVIDFPNHSRSYDPTRRAVRFWGYDSAIEASFFINEDALTRIQPDARPDESGFLDAFDSNRDLICAAAARIYVRGSRGSYDLVAANF
jgi:hypothetical protein